MRYRRCSLEVIIGIDTMNLGGAGNAQANFETYMPTTLESLETEDDTLLTDDLAFAAEGTSEQAKDQVCVLQVFFHIWPYSKNFRLFGDPEGKRKWE